MSVAGVWRVLDGCCKAGGAGAGYAAHPGVEVVGVDIRPQPRYPFEFIQGDIVQFIRDHGREFDFIHVSPPCQFGTEMRHAPGTRKDHVNLIPAVREALIASGRPYVIENVIAVRPHLINPVSLNGAMFGHVVTARIDASGREAEFLLERERLFECNFPVRLPGSPVWRGPIIGVYGAHVRCRSIWRDGGGDFPWDDKKALAKLAMGIEHDMTMAELSEAIPPVYTHYLFGEFLRSCSL